MISIKCPDSVSQWGPMGHMLDTNAILLTIKLHHINMGQPQTFIFIDGVQPTKSSKRLMRHHVMKGKNAGKRFHRSSRTALNTHEPRVFEPTRHIQPWSHVEKKPVSSVDRSFGDAILTSSLPMVEIHPHSLNIINQCGTLSIPCSFIS